MPLVTKVSYNLQKFAYLLYPRVCIYQGVDNRTEAPISFLYAGFHKHVEEFYVKFILADGYVKRELGRQFLWNIPALIRQKAPLCNLMLAEHSLLSRRFLPSMPGFRIPYWVTMEVDLTVPRQELMGEQRNKTQRLMFLNGLTYDFSRRKEDFEDYYHNMFLPYIKGRYPDSSLEGKDQYEKIFERGELLLVKKRGQVVAGGLMQYTDTEVKLKTVGVRDAKRELVSEGALAAIYWGSMVEMRKRGHHKVHLGGTRPFFSDGVTKYKASVGASLTKNCMHSCVWVNLLNDSLGLRGFLTKNSFVFIDEDGSQCRAVFWEIDQHPNQNEFDRLVHCSCTGGAIRTYLFIVGDYNIFMNKIQYSELPWLIVKPFEELFAFGSYIPVPQLTTPLMTQV